MNWTKKSIAKLSFFIIVCEAVGASGSVFTAPSIPTWYASLTKPFFNPPSWLFGPAWTVLFALMGVSLYLVWEKGSKNKKLKDRKFREALFAFGMQFALNVLWSFLFFGLRSPLYALVEIIFLWVAIAVTIFKFYKISRTASFILVPYLAWVSFAAVLNYYVWILNL